VDGDASDGRAPARACQDPRTSARCAAPRRGPRPHGSRNSRRHSACRMSRHARCSRGLGIPCARPSRRSVRPQPTPKPPRSRSHARRRSRRQPTRLADAAGPVVERSRPTAWIPGAVGLGSRTRPAAGRRSALRCHCRQPRTDGSTDISQCAPPARRLAAEYGAEQAALRSLEEPLPPRDLWARTAAAPGPRRSGRRLATFRTRACSPVAAACLVLVAHVRFAACAQSSGHRRSGRSAPDPTATARRTPRARRRAPPGLHGLRRSGRSRHSPSSSWWAGTRCFTGSAVTPIGSPLAATSTLAAAGKRDAVRDSDPGGRGRGPRGLPWPRTGPTASTSRASTRFARPTRSPTARRSPQPRPRHLPNRGFDAAHRHPGSLEDAPRRRPGLDEEGALLVAASSDRSTDAVAASTTAAPPSAAAGLRTGRLARESPSRFLLP